MFAAKESFTVTASSSDGAGTGYSGVVNGRVLSIAYCSTTIPTTGTLTFTNEATTESILVKGGGSSKWTSYPRPAVNTSTGGSVVYSTASANAKVRDYYYIAGTRLKCALAGAGGARTATIIAAIG